MCAAAALSLSPAAALAYPVPFSPTSYLNTPLAPRAPLDPASTTMVQDLLQQVRQHGVWVNTTRFSSPVYTVPAGQPTVSVASATGNAGLAGQLTHVPLPAGAQPAAGTDQHLTVWQPSTDTLWEFWQLRRDASGGWVAQWGGRLPNVSSNPGAFTYPPGGQYGATATGIPLLAGLQRVGELQAGSIDHAVAFSMYAPAPCYRWPATRQDKFVSDQQHMLGLPEGARLRLPSDLNIDHLNLPPYTAMLAKAIQKYGMVLRDRATTLAFYAEDPTPTGSNPFTGPAGIFGGLSPDQWGLFRNFPWSRLQVLGVPFGQSGCAGLINSPPEPGSP